MSVIRALNSLSEEVFTAVDQLLITTNVLRAVPLKKSPGGEDPPPLKKIWGQGGLSKK